MKDVQKRIADKVRGVAAENRATQQQIADSLQLDRKTVNSRLNGHTPFTGAELWTLSVTFSVEITAFYPARSAVVVGDAA